MNNSLTKKEQKLIIWFHRILRWGFGIAMIIFGFTQSSYVSIVIGSIMTITGFFKPVRCMGDSCKN
jgi:hypothetical protein